MNKQDRAELQKAVELIDQAKVIVESIRDGEQEKFDNLTEGFQQSKRGQKMEESVSVLDSTAESLSTAIDDIESVIL